jgi:hypothetical protein
MPVASFLELGPNPRAIPGHASDYTRYLRLHAQSAPTIRQDIVQKGGWRSPTLATDIAIYRPICQIAGRLIHR